MQSALNIGNEVKTTLIPANELREKTVSQEVIYKRKKDSILDSLMSNMVNMATEQGKTTFGANFEPNFNPGLLAEITKELTDLGYTVKSEAKNSEQMGAYIALTVSW